jgi:hypothetical protein
MATLAITPLLFVEMSQNDVMDGERAGGEFGVIASVSITLTVTQHRVPSLSVLPVFAAPLPNLEVARVSVSGDDNEGTWANSFGDAVTISG